MLLAKPPTSYQPVPWLIEMTKMMKTILITNSIVVGIGVPNAVAIFGIMSKLAIYSSQYMRPGIDCPFSLVT
jgi:hypothetical protein